MLDEKPNEKEKPKETEESSPSDAELRDELEKLRSENEELKDKYLRVLAEFENFRKRQERIMSEMLEQERNNIAGHLLDIADDVRRALSAAEGGCEPETLVEGIRLIAQRIEELLRLEGVVVDDPKGKRFDPLEHEAISTASVESPDEDGVVVDVVQPAYKRAGKLIRPAKVVVGKFEEKKEG